jgi:hypothetical protein
MLSNSIFSNEGPGIDLWTMDGNGNLAEGINENDPLDADEGNNNLQNYPVLMDFYSGSTGTSIAGYLESVPNKTFKLQFFSNSPNPNLLDPREGESLLGEKLVTTDNNGYVEFQANIVNVSVNIADGHSVSATATDESGNTSEFSMSIVAEYNDGDHYLLNTTLGGIPLHWKEGKAKYSVAPSVVIKGYDSEIQEAFNTYSALDQLTFTRRFLPPDSTNENWGGNPDGVNNVVWMTPAQWSETDIPENVLAATRVRYNTLTGEMTDVDIAFNGVPYSFSFNTTFEWSVSGLVMINLMFKILQHMKLGILSD